MVNLGIVSKWGHEVRANIFTSVIAVAAAMSQPISAKPAVTPAIRLTPTDGQQSSGCTLFLDRRQRISVGWMHLYDNDGEWNIGINGRIYTLRSLPSSSQVETLVNRSRTIRVVIRSIRRLEYNNNDNAPQELRLVSLDIYFGRQSRVINAYQYCSDH